MCRLDAKLEKYLLGKIQNEAGMIESGLTRSVSLQKLYTVMT